MGGWADVMPHLKIDRKKRIAFNDYMRSKNLTRKAQCEGRQGKGRRAGQRKHEFGQF